MCSSETRQINREEMETMGFGLIKKMNGKVGENRSGQVREFETFNGLLGMMVW